MTTPAMRFNPPPGWPQPPEGWEPDSNWRPDPSWPPAPPGWNFWIVAEQPPPPPPPPPPPSTTPPALAAEPRKEEATREAGEPTATPADDNLRAEIQEELKQVRAELLEARADLNRERAKVAELSAANVPSVDTSTQAVAQGKAEDLAAVQSEIAAAREKLVEVNDAVLLQQVGIYDYHHPLENAEDYKTRLADLRERVKNTVRIKAAILASDRFAYNNSLAQGRRMTADFSKLMLRAYNAEADNCVRSLRAGSIHAAIRRLETSVETIARLGAMMEMRVSPGYHALRVEELELTSDYLFKVQEEREAAREERERLREERRAEQELAAERERLDKERTHYANALAVLRDQGKADEVADLQSRLEQIDAAIEQNDFRAANIRAGYVYVISNIGSFGPNVVKIGLTRRLVPLERVRELGDASVPFPFDVHAIYFSNDAVQLETELHAAFAQRRLNQVNLRREFFFATPAQVRDVLKTKVGNLLEFTDEPEATQYFQSHGAWPKLGPEAVAHEPSTFA